MRVAVLHPGRTEPDGTVVPESVAAFRLGRIHDFVNHITGETVQAADVARALFDQATKEHPECRVVIEHLVDNGDGTSTWTAAENVPVGAQTPGGGPVGHEHELTAEQAQAVEGGSGQ